MSPTGTLIAMLWTRGFERHGWLDIYDISSGQRVSKWEVPARELTYDQDRGIAWDLNSQTVYLAAPSSVPCLAPRGTHDVFGFDARTGAITAAFTTGLLVGDIAVTPGELLLAVDANCVGVHSNRNPKLVVFDLKRNNLTREVRAEKTGIRYKVSVSRNGQRAVAWTSDVRCRFDWCDMVSYGCTADPMFTVWRLPDFSVVVSSPKLFVRGRIIAPDQEAVALRMGSTGHYLLVYGTSGLVFELP